MTGTEVVRQLKSLVDDRKSFLNGIDDEIFQDDITALNEAIEIITRGCAGCSCNADLEESKKLKHYFEVLFTDGSPSVCVENGESWCWNEDLLVVYGESNNTIATFNVKNVRGIIKREEQADYEMRVQKSTITKGEKYDKRIWCIYCTEAR